jgi:hypothetical protein
VGGATGRPRSGQGRDVVPTTAAHGTPCVPRLVRAGTRTRTAARPPLWPDCPGTRSSLAGRQPLRYTSRSTTASVCTISHTTRRRSTAMAGESCCGRASASHRHGAVAIGEDAGGHYSRAVTSPGARGPMQAGTGTAGMPAVRTACDNFPWQSLLVLIEHFDPAVVILLPVFVSHTGTPCTQPSLVHACTVIGMDRKLHGTPPGR